MKKLFLIPSVALSVLGTVSAFAQEAVVETVAAETEIAGESMHQILMQKFLEGGWGWMLPILLCLVIGLAVAIERILYLTLSTINSKKLIAAVDRTDRFRPARWSRVFRGSASSSPSARCSDLWVPWSA